MSWSGPAFTPVSIPPIPERIFYSDSILMLGSCFTEHIANKLSRFKYSILHNPFGILYNPASLAESIGRIVEKKYYSFDELVAQDGLYHSLDHHGFFSGVNKDEVLNVINQAIETAHHHLSKCRFIFISPGTTRVYRYKSTGRIVGNCHKIPQAQFEKSNLTFQESQDSFNEIYQLIQGIAPSAKIIWTISPVRHIRDGLIDNQRSKAALVMSAESMTARHPNCFYFPAYEIMIDQLRDYRYYAKDLLHPSDAAIDIIWTMFCEHYIDQNELKVHTYMERINQGMSHRIFHSRPAAITDFAISQLELIDRTNMMVPTLNFSAEKQYFSSLIQPE